MILVKALLQVIAMRWERNKQNNPGQQPERHPMPPIRMLVPVFCLLLPFVATTATAQTHALGDTLTVIQRPLPNLPSLVLPGSDLVVSCVADPGATAWTVALERGSLQIPLTVTGAAYDPLTLWWTVTATVPEMPVFDLYDLHVTADGGLEGDLDDVAKQAVKVLSAFRDDFTFVHITDTHLPTYLYYYQSGADTDSTTLVNLREIIADVNLINPEFVLLTGDFIHEGELEDFLDKRYYSRAQRMLYEFDVPVFLTAGNHDIGGWNDTPPPDGTARRDWWRFFGWRRLADPPPAVPWYTQNYSFDYGPVHFIGLEAYDNYDNWLWSIYGNESFTSGQLSWLSQDIAAAAASTNVLFHHYDFQNQLNLNTLGIDMALWGHIHRDTDDFNAPYDISTDNAGDASRPYRLIRFTGGQLDPRPTLTAGYDGQTLSASFAPANDGTNDLVTVEIDNGHNERFENGLVRVLMPADAAAYLVTGGTLLQVDDTSSPAVCYVQVDIPARRVLQVTVEVDDTTAADVPSRTSPRLIGAQPNPFNPRTEICFELPQAAACSLVVFDLQGRQVRYLLAENLPAGTHTVTWDGQDDLGQTLASGLYFLGFRAGDYAETRKLTLVR